MAYLDTDTQYSLEDPSGVPSPDWFAQNAPPVAHHGPGMPVNDAPSESWPGMPSVAAPAPTPDVGSVGGNIGDGLIPYAPVQPFTGQGYYPDVPIPDYLQQPYQIPTMPGVLSSPYALPTMADLQNSPGYMSRYKMGFDARQRAAAAQGTLLNGGTLKALDRYGQDYASNEYGNLVGQQIQARGVNEGEYQNAIAASLAGRNQQVNDWQQLTNQPAQNRYGSLYQQYLDLIGNNRNAQNDYTNALLHLNDTGASAAMAGNPGTGGA